jgi:hypothetical protein
MPILEDWELTVDVDQVLRGQGADPQMVRDRSPKIVEAAEWALAEGRELIHPRVLYEQYDVDELRHEKLRLRNGSELTGKLITQHLSPASSIVAVLCTIGSELENRANEVSSDDLILGLALDGLGSAAVEILANACCSHFEAHASSLDQSTSIPISPGMIGWSVEVGQQEIFNHFDSREVDVTLTESMLMIPKKSLTFVLGMGTQILDMGTSCDYCSLRETCRYQDHYADADA